MLPTAEGLAPDITTPESCHWPWKTPLIDTPWRMLHDLGHPVVPPPVFQHKVYGWYNAKFVIGTSAEPVNEEHGSWAFSGAFQPLHLHSTPFYYNYITQKAVGRARSPLLPLWPYNVGHSKRLILSSIPLPSHKLCQGRARWVTLAQEMGAAAAEEFQRATGAG